LLHLPVFQYKELNVLFLLSCLLFALNTRRAEFSRIVPFSDQKLPLNLSWRVGANDELSFEVVAKNVLDEHVDMTLTPSYEGSLLLMIWMQ